MPGTMSAGAKASCSTSANSCSIEGEGGTEILRPSLLAKGAPASAAGASGGLGSDGLPSAGSS
eukprot:scaffold173_cov221-Pinguiococcus_pyrenoidosus.AAC.7